MATLRLSTLPCSGLVLSSSAVPRSSISHRHARGTLQIRRQASHRRVAAVSNDDGRLATEDGTDTAVGALWLALRST